MPILIKSSHIRVLLKLAQAIDTVSEKLGRLSGWMVLLTIAVGFYNATARYLGRFIGLKLASNALIELQSHLFSLTFFLGFAYILKQAVNVRVDFLYANWSEKRRALVDFLGTVFLLIPFCVLAIWVSFNPVLQSWGLLPDGTWGSWEMSSDAEGMPRAPIKTMMIVAFVWLLAQAIAEAVKCLAVLKGYLPISQISQADDQSPDHPLPLE